MSKKVSFICTTYRRFECVERIIAQFYAQTYPNKELIIFNTDVEYPLVLDFEDPSIIVVNNNINYETKTEYTNRGDICRDAVTHATGYYFMLADDDDVYLPWHIQQAVDRIEETGKDAWKPKFSFFATRDKLETVQNTLEASLIVKIERIREIGFRNDKTGYEGLNWYTKLRDEKQFSESFTDFVPSYCFNWSDPHEIAGHKQSGNIDNPTNFDEHKLCSYDYAERPLRRDYDLTEFYKPYFEYLTQHYNDFPSNRMIQYVSKYIQTD